MKLHWQILIGLFAGAAFGIFAAVSQLSEFTHDWITPFGTLFVNLLKLIAMRWCSHHWSPVLLRCQMSASCHVWVAGPLAFT